MISTRYHAGEAAAEGSLNDYAFFMQGLLDLKEACIDVRWPAWAVQPQQAQVRLFWDGKDGGYLTTQGTGPSLLMQTPFQPLETEAGAYGICED